MDRGIEANVQPFSKLSRMNHFSVLFCKTNYDHQNDKGLTDSYLHLALFRPPDNKTGYASMSKNSL
jgi:hypothetical protein